MKIFIIFKIVKSFLFPAPVWCSGPSAFGSSGVCAVSLLPRRGSGRAADHDPAASVGGEEKRAAGHQEEAPAVREQEERHAGELHPAQVRCFATESPVPSTELKRLTQNSNEVPQKVPEYLQWKSPKSS